MSGKLSSVRLRERITSDGLLLLTAIIWGGGFVAQRLGSFTLGFFAFNGVRFLIGGLALLPFVLKRFPSDRRRLGWVFLSGLILFVASALQQAGVETTTAGSAGFITGVYVVLVPILLTVFWRQPTPAATWLAALAALGGTYLLSTGGSRLNPSSGDLLVLAGALVWALHVIVVGQAVQKVNAFLFSAGQFLVAGVLHLAMSFFSKPVTLSALQGSLLPLLYSGLISVAVGFTLQAVGQRKAPAADAALILSLETVFAALAGVVFLAERMNPLQVIGSSIILVAILGGQLAVLRRRSQLEKTKIIFSSKIDSNHNI